MYRAQLTIVLKVGCLGDGIEWSYQCVAKHDLSTGKTKQDPFLFPPSANCTPQQITPPAAAGSCDAKSRVEASRTSPPASVAGNPHTHRIVAPVQQRQHKSATANWCPATYPNREGASPLPLPRRRRRRLRLPRSPMCGGRPRGTKNLSNPRPPLKRTSK